MKAFHVTKIENSRDHQFMLSALIQGPKNPKRWRRLRKVSQKRKLKAEEIGRKNAGGTEDEATERRSPVTHRKHAFFSLTVVDSPHQSLLFKALI